MGVTSLGSLASAAAHFTILNSQLKHAEHAIIVRACQMVAKRAKDSMGTDGYNWTALSPNTKKTQPGMLLETGEMRDSIKWNAEGNKGHVGSDLDKAVWHELGTTKIPPRSFLAASAQHEGPAIQRMAGKTVAAMVGGSAGHSEFEQILHIAERAFHKVKDLAEDVLEGPNHDEGK